MYLMMQLVWCALGLIACVTAAVLDYRIAEKTRVAGFRGSRWFWLALVFVPHLGHENQRRAPLDPAARQRPFQPSEFAKIALIIMLAWYGDRSQRQMHTWKRGIIIPGMHHRG